MSRTIIPIRDILDGKQHKTCLPKWMEDAIQNHKSRWEADSKGGEPNCRREENE